MLLFLTMHSHGGGGGEGSQCYFGFIMTLGLEPGVKKNDEVVY